MRIVSMHYGNASQYIWHQILINGSMDHVYISIAAWIIQYIDYLFRVIFSTKKSDKANVINQF